MRGLPFDDYREAPHALAGRLELPRGPQRRLQNECPLGDARESTDVSRGFPAADLLIRVDEEHRGDGGLELEVPQYPQREQHLHQPALHVVYTGTPDHAVSSLDRHLLKRPERPDGIAVPEQELHRRVTRAAQRPRVEMAAALLARDAAHCKAQLSEDLGDDAQHLILSLRLRRWGLR